MLQVRNGKVLLQAKLRADMCLMPEAGEAKEEQEPGIWREDPEHLEGKGIQMIGICCECKREREVLRMWKGHICGHCHRTMMMKRRRGFGYTVYKPKGDLKERL